MLLKQSLITSEASEKNRLISTMHRPLTLPAAPNRALTFAGTGVKFLEIVGAHGEREPIMGPGNRATIGIQGRDPGQGLRGEAPEAESILGAKLSILLTCEVLKYAFLKNIVAFLSFAHRNDRATFCLKPLSRFVFN